MNNKKNFWLDLKKNKNRIGEPIFALAPMAGVTDSAFRQLCREYGADVVYSEMASVNALFYAPEKTLELLKYKELEKPYIVQLFGGDSDNFANAIKVIEKEIKPDGIDINFGCPVPKVAKQNAGAELSKNLKLSREIIEITVKSTDLPVSIKIRARVGEVDALRFLDNISDLDVKAAIIHGRSLKQMHSGAVDAEIIKKSRDFFGGIIVANGGVKDKKTADNLLRESRADGIAIGQGSFGRPWIFEEIRNENLKPKEIDDVFKIALRHAELSLENKGEQGIIEMRKHLCWYVSGFARASDYRREFVKVENISDIKAIVKKTF